MSNVETLIDRFIEHHKFYNHDWSKCNITKLSKELKVSRKSVYSWLNKKTVPRSKAVIEKLSNWLKTQENSTD